MGRPRRVTLVAAIAALPVFGCYGHTRWDGPAPVPSVAGNEMIQIPEGRFTRGDLNGEPAEYPEHQVDMHSFLIDRYEVSNRSYRLCVRAGACDVTPYLEHPELGQPDHPVVGVSWDDARRFCQWVGRRLPTEAEWEYAARGSDGRRFPWNGPFDPRRANTDRNEDAYATTAPIGELGAGDSPFGVRNMAGNAAEWVQDFFDPVYYRRTFDKPDPRGPRRGHERVVRGGSYRDSPYLVRVAARRAQIPTDIDNTVGVRCAR